MSRLTTEPIPLLVIEDSLSDFALMERHLARQGIPVRCRRVDSLEAVGLALESGHWQAVLSDFNVPGMCFGETLGVVRDKVPDIPIIVVTGTIGEERAVELLKQGATDFVLKDNLHRLGHALYRALDEAAERRARAVATAEQHRLGEALRQSAQPILLADAEVRITYVNPAFVDLMGYAPEELAGRPIASLYPAESGDHGEFQEINDHIRSHGTWSGEVLRVARDGDRIPLFATVGASHDLCGRLVGYVVTYLDLRPAREKARALEISEAKYKSVLDHAADAVFVVGRDGRYLYVNRQASRMLGYSREELLALSVPDITPEEDAEHAADTFREVVTAGHARTELVLEKKDGTRIAVDLNAIMLPDDTAFGACRDITARKRAEAQLREQEALLKDMSAMAQIGGWAFDPASGTGRWTDEAARIHDLPDGAAISVASGLEYCVGEHRQRIEAAIRDVVARAEPYDLEVMIRTPAGREKWVRTAGRPVVVDGKVVEVRGTTQDITARVRAEAEAARTKADLIHASRLTLIGEVASKIAHEVHQPLGAISNFLQSAQAMASGNVALSALLDKAMAQVRRTSDTIRKVKALASNGEMDLRPEDLRPLVEDACSLALLGAVGEGVNASIRIPASLPRVLVDRIQVQQVFVNLVRNAAEAMAGSPVRTLSIEARLVDSPATVEVVVADTGPGIPSDGIDNLFKPFVTTKRDGTGLGLSISRSIMYSHGGKLDLIPSSQGAVFKVSIPVASE